MPDKMDNHKTFGDLNIGDLLYTVLCDAVKTVWINQIEQRGDCILFEGDDVDDGTLVKWLVWKYDMWKETTSDASTCKPLATYITNRRAFDFKKIFRRAKHDKN